MPNFLLLGYCGNEIIQKILRLNICAKRGITFYMLSRSFFKNKHPSRILPFCFNMCAYISFFKNRRHNHIANSKWIMERATWEANNANIKFKKINQEIPIGIAIFKDSILQIVWDIEEPVAFLLRSKQLAQQYEDFFFSLWNRN